MRKLSVGLSLFALGLFSTSAFGQARKSANTRAPISVDSSYFQALGVTPKVTGHNRMSAEGNAATKQQPDRIVSLPNFTSSFTFDGQVFPFTMLGRSPRSHQTVNIPTTYVPMSFFFDEFVDANGNNIVIDANAITSEIKDSPNFENAEYSSGFTQFGDAVQRAEFFNLINKDNDNDGDDSYHVLLDRPRTLTPVTIEVPVGSSIVFQLPDGSLGTLIDINFLSSQLNTLLQTEGVTVDSLPIFITRNAVYGDFLAGVPQDCCIGGFHTAFETNQVKNKIFVQVFDFATSLDPDVADFVFGDPTIFSDVEALSHEISETMNDPFVNNVTPNYQIPGAPTGVCQAILETGDVIEDLQPAFFPVLLHGFTYHPQTEGLLQWFEGQKPSSAIDGAYSYPDPTKLTSPFTPCPPATSAN
ncbi:MAG: hypothetical protein ACRD4S_12010 [Candidatus Acidiferrales bacterium]